jgi:hypothetical protein
MNSSHVVITGASAGIGLEFARQCGSRAKALTLVARRKDRLESLAEEIRGAHPGCAVRVASCDLLDVAATEAMLAAAITEVGPVDVLINNAGFGDVRYFDEAPFEKLERMIALNVTSLTRLTHAVLPGMLERGRGGILNVSSLAGLHAIPGYAVYTGTKHYVTALTKALRVEAAGSGVHITQLNPGPVATEFTQVAEIPPERSAPALVELSAERCARIGLRGLERNRAIVVPGLLMRINHRLLQWTPDFLMHFIWRLLLVRLAGRRGRGREGGER